MHCSCFFILFNLFPVMHRSCFFILIYLQLCTCHVYFILFYLSLGMHWSFYLFHLIYLQSCVRENFEGDLCGIKYAKIGEDWIVGTL